MGQPGTILQPRAFESFLFESDGRGRPNRLVADKYDGGKQAMYTKLPASPIPRRGSSPPAVNERLRQRVLFGGQIVLLVVVIVQFVSKLMGNTSRSLKHLLTPLF